MKVVTTLLLSICGLAYFSANAQTSYPEGFKKATITLADGSIIAGFAKDNIRKTASVLFIQNAESKKKNYDGSSINAIEIEGVSFICKNGDFFKVVCLGEKSLVQKASDASGKVNYNGPEVTVSTGTEGKIGDYFIWKNNRELSIVEKKNIDAVVATEFSACALAVVK